LTTRGENAKIPPINKLTYNRRLIMETIYKMLMGFGITTIISFIENFSALYILGQPVREGVFLVFLLPIPVWIMRELQRFEPKGPKTDVFVDMATFIGLYAGWLIAINLF
jgi:hypothetical protein